jgi:hypothetical protein
MGEGTRLDNILRAQLADPATSWSLGSFGVIAEFVRDTDEPVATADTGLAAATDRGAIRLHAPDELRLFASEGITRESWSQRVALCLPQASCAMHRRAVLTELGPDADAIRAADRDAILFDIGLDVVQADICVRIRDRDVVDRLRACVGQPAFAHGNPAMGIILAANPHRVFISRVGRIEVYAPIPPADGTSPEGPHTHVLPKLLRHRRTHAATEPVPDGWVPCAHFYPAHPAKDANGRQRPYEARHHDAFQAMLQTFGDADQISLKRRMKDAIAAGHDPSAFAVPEARFARAAMRIGLRQMLVANGPSPSLAAWQQSHERAQREADADEGDEIDH